MSKQNIVARLESKYFPKNFGLATLLVMNRSAVNMVCYERSRTVRHRRFGDGGRKCFMRKKCVFL